MFFQQLSPHIEASMQGTSITSLKDAEGIAIANIGFSSGIHYWEVHCPFSCEGLKFGVLREGYTVDSYQAHLELFRTTTPRTVGMLLNLEEKTLKFFLNGNLSPNKGVGKGLSINELLDDCKWFPCVQMSQYGNQAILCSGFQNRNTPKFNPIDINIPKPISTIIAIPIERDLTLNGNAIVFRDGYIQSTRNCIFKYQQLLKQEYYVLLQDCPWNYAQPDTQFIQKLTHIHEQGENVYLDLPFDSAADCLLRALAYLKWNVEQLESIVKPLQLGEDTGPKVMLQVNQPKQQEDNVISKLKQLIHQQLPQEEPEIVKPTYQSVISIHLSRQLQQIIVKLIDQLDHKLDASTSYLYGLNSAKQRLKTFVDHPSTENPFTIVESGYYLQPGFKVQHRHFQEQSTKGLQLQTNSDNQLILRSQVQGQGKLVKGRSQRYFALQDKVGKVAIFNGEAELFYVGTINLKEVGPFRTQVSIEQQPKQEAPSDIYKILENYLSIETQQLVLQDEKLIQLLAMGFNEIQSKDALLKCNNNLEEALDFLSSYPKAWLCTVCTLLNQGTALICEACESPKQDQAELPIQINDNHIPIEDAPIIQQCVEKIPKEQARIIEESEISCILQIHVQGTVAPLLYLSVHNHNILSIKRCSIDELYLNQFYSLVDDGVYCKLTNQYTKNKSDYSALGLQNETSRQIIETLAPLYSIHKEQYKFTPYDHIAYDIQDHIQDLEYMEFDGKIYVFIITKSNLQIWNLELGCFALNHIKTLQVNGITHIVATSNRALLYGNKAYKFEFSTWNLVELQNFSIKSAHCDNGEIFITDLNNRVIQWQDCPVAPAQKLDQHEFTTEILEKIEAGITQETNQVYSTLFDDQHPITFELSENLISVTIEAVFQSQQIPELKAPSCSQLINQYKVPDPQPLALTVHSFEGSQFNNSTHVTTVLYDTVKSFTSNYAKAEIIFKSQFAAQMQVSHVVVKSDLTNQQKGFPIGSGLIFCSDSTRDFQNSNVFDGMCADEYAEWRTYRNSIALEYGPWEPVGCFEFKGEELQVTCYLDVIRPCHFILLKPTNFRKYPYDSTAHFNQNPIEIREFAAYGKISTEQSHKFETLGKVNESILLEELRKRLVITSNEPISYEAPAYECLAEAALKARYPYRVKQSMNIPNNGLLKIELPLTGQKCQFQLNPQFSDWRLLKLTVSGMKCNSQLHSELRKSIMNPQQYNEINHKLVELLYQNDAVRRNAALKILNIAMKNPVILLKIQQQLNLSKFLIVNVLPHEINSLISEFIGNLQTLPQFSDSLVEASQHILTKIEKLIITEAGLETFLTLLKYTSQLKGPEVVQMCTTALLNQLKNIQNQQANKYLDPFIFSTKYTLPQNIKMEQQQLETDVHPVSKAQCEGLKPLVCKKDPLSQILKTQSTSKHHIKTFNVNLLGEFAITKISLRFQNFNVALRFRVQVWVDSKLHLDESFQDWTFLQFADFAHKTKFPNSPCLQLPLEVVARQLTVQITLAGDTYYSKSQYLAAIPQQQLVIVPEFYGALLNPYPKQIDLPNWEEFKFKTTLLLGDQVYYSYQSDHSLLLDSYNIFQSTFNSSDYYIVIDNQQGNKKNIAFLESAIQQLQMEMQIKSKAGLPIDHLKQLIEGSQIELHRVSQARNYENNYNFQFTLCCNLVQLLNEVDQVPSQNVGHEIAQLFIGLDMGQLSDLGIGYINSKLYPSFPANEWADFILNVYKLLGDPKQHTRLLRHLKVLQIPIAETMECLIRGSEPTIEGMYFSLLASHLQNVPAYDYFIEEAQINKDNLTVGLNYLTRDPEFRLDLITKLLNKCSAKQIKEVVTEQLLNDLTQNGFKHQKKLRILMDVLFQPRQLPSKYSEWSALQILEEGQRMKIEQERYNLKYVGKFVLYYYQQLLQREIENIQIDRLLLLFDFLSAGVSKINKEIRQIEKRTKSKLEKQDSGKQKTEFDDFLKRQHIQVCSSVTVRRLTELLEVSDDYLVWNKVLKVIHMMSPSQINDELLYPQVISAFLKCKNQVLIMQELLQFTLNLQALEVQRSTTCTIIVQTLIEHLQNQQLSNVFVIASQKLLNVRLGNVEQLLTVSAEYLMKQANVGGKDGILLASMQTIDQLEVANALLDCVLQSEKAEPQLYQLKGLKDQALEQIIYWYILNGSFTATGSIGLNLLKVVSDQVDSIVDIIGQHQAAKLLTILFKTHMLVEEQLINLLAQSAISDTTANQIAQQSSEYLSSKFEKLLTTDDVAQQVALHSNAFHYLIQKIIKDKQSGEFLNNKMSYVLDIKEEEFGQKLKVVNLPGQTLQQVPDWSQNKKGVKNRVSLIQLPTTSRSEYQLLLQLDQEIELKSLKIGFQTFTSDFTDKILGTPSQVILEVGQTQTELYPVQELQFVNDETYSQYQVKVFAYNAQFPTGTSAFPQQRLVKYISLRMKSPTVQMIEGIGQWAGKNYKKVCLGINFISVSGHELAKLPQNKLEYIWFLQESISIDLICKLCKPNFNGTLHSLAHDSNIIKLIKQSFPKLMKALITYYQQLSPLVMAVSKYNSEIGDWIIEQLITSTGELQHAKLLTQIILSNSKEYERLLKLHNYLIPYLLALSTSNRQSQDILQYQKVTPYIDAYCTIMLLHSKNSTDKQRCKTIPIHKDEIIHLISLLELVHTNSTHQLLIKLIITLTYLPHPFLEIEHVEQILTFTWNMAEIHPQYMNLLAPLSLGTPQSILWISNQLPKIVKTLIKYLSLDEIDKSNQLLIKYYISFITTVTQIKQCSDSILSLLKNIYDALIEDNPNISKRILKSIDDQTIGYFTQFFTHMLQQYQAKFILEALIKDIKKLESVNDMRFVQLLLVPMLNSEETVKFCVNFKDGDQFISDPRAVASKVVQGDLNNIIQQQQEVAFDSNILTTDQVQIVAKSLKNMNWERVAFQKTDGDSTLLPVLEDKFLMAQSNLMIIQYQQGAETGILGIVNYQPSVRTKRINTDTLYQMQGDQDTVFFLFNKNGHKVIKPNLDFIGNLDIYDAQGTFEFQLSGQTFLQIEYVEGENSRINLIAFQEASQQSLIDSIKVEYWIQKPQHPQLIPKQNTLTLPVLYSLAQLSSQYIVSTLGYGELSSLIFPIDFYESQLAFNYFRATPVYKIPASLSVTQLRQFITMNGYKLKDTTKLLSQVKQLKELAQDGLGIIDYEIDSKMFIEDINLNAKGTKLSYQSQMGVFTVFEELDGVRAIIEVVKNGIKQWKNHQRAQAWLLFVDELWSFCYLPTFFNQFMKNQLCVNLLFDLLAGSPDVADPTKIKKWEEEEQNAVKFIYQTLVNVFASFNTSEVRVIALEKNLIQHILDRIALVSKESKRTYQEEQEEDEKIAPTLAKLESKELKKLPLKKRGIGYASDNTGNNSKWNTAEYVEKKNIRSLQLISLLGIVESFFDFQHWHPSEALLNKLQKTLFESALLPLLESAFRSGSLLEISKEFDLYHSFLKIVKSMSKHRVLAPVFMKLSPNYVPQQTQSIQELLNTLQENAQIFLNCMKNTQKKNQEEKTSQDIAMHILEAYAAMEEAISKYQSGQSDSDDDIVNEEQLIIQRKQAANALIKEILIKPLPEAYRMLLSDLRFDYIDMKLNGRYKHHYSSQIQANYTPPQAKVVRLAQEFADMSTSLPIEHTNAIFVRADKERVDVLKAMVMGAKGTPYAHGAFVFDIFVDDNYPNGPPKMNLSTTGNAKVRFNPNLYSCGKVCLSLLGTWRGNASENWDAKLSTLLQVLVSTQAIIMAEEVYFNEPGFEQESGTEEGDKKNEGYSNIVRYGNVKFAMIDTIRDPPKGFETIVKRHFYLKKDEIMEECKKWVEYSETKEALYTGLINDHNSQWCNEFKKSKQYNKKLVEAVKELEIELNKLQPPSAEDLEGSKVLKAHIKNQPKIRNIKEGMANLDDIDMTYDLTSQVKEMTINDENVVDRWSRYIGAMGMDAVKKQSNSQVFISGLGPLGVEICKNIVMSGVKQLTLHDHKTTTYKDLTGQFFLGEVDIGKNRAESSLNKLQQLNFFVKVNTLNLDQQLPDNVEDIEKTFNAIQSYNLVILSQYYPNNILVAWSIFCRKHKIKLIVSSVDGVFARLINDFGEEFTVEDKNGETCQDLVVKSISNSAPGKVELLQGTKHDFEDGDMVLLDNVVGMESSTGQSINKTVHKVKIISKTEFLIEDTTAFSAYVRNGTVRLLKLPVKINFQPVHTQLTNEPKYDMQMSTSDFLKIKHPEFLHLMYQGISQLQPQQKLTDIIDTEEDQEFSKLLNQFQNTYELGEFPSMSAFMGGFVSSEAIKALTNKFMPVQQVYYTDCIEVLPDVFEPTDLLNTERSLTRFLGGQFTQKLEESKIFMVGCGAIGCELLKNFAMLNLGVQGSITITDPDHIEVSNLNRQFLFREKHIRKPKSQTAAAASIQMNPLLKNHIVARLDKVHDGTEHIFTDQFFEGLDIVANALDNVAARRYVDRRCVDAKIPLLESGTLGPKGHVQCIIPYQTESYGSSNDPVEEGDIPYCTLKMFPEEVFHCVEFARDKFGKLFSFRPKTIQKMLETPDYAPTSSEESKALREGIKLFRNVPKTYEDCIIWARGKFEKYFVKDIKQLLYTYPLDHQTKDGNLFWTLPKRPPQPIAFNPADKLHQQFISTFAYMRARMYGIPYAPDWRTPQQRSAVAEIGAKQKYAEWQPSEEKKQNINSQVLKNDKQHVKQEDEEQEVETQTTSEELVSLFEQFNALKGKIQLIPDEFEKDNDQNGHIDFIHSFGNLRAGNYKLDEMDWVTVKIKAGRIVPALATTTAVVAGLQTIELIKTLKKVPLDKMKNGFVNLAIPFIQLIEPGVVPKITLTEDVVVTLWDRWAINITNQTTLGDLFVQLHDKYKLFAKNVFIKGSPLYMEVMMSKKPQERQQMLDTRLVKLLDSKSSKFIDLTVNFTISKESNEIIKGVPLIRIIFTQKQHE